MRVAVIGGGLQGSCLALELAGRGVQVDLVEAGPRVMDGASRHTEGKLHLGFVYANDPGLATADLMMRGAASFGPLLRRWLGPEFDDVPVSDGFEYVVHEDSLLGPDQLAETYREVAARIRRFGSWDYVGRPLPDRVERLPEAEWQGRYGRSVRAVFRTDEVAIDPTPLADLVAQAVESAAGIAVMTDLKVRCVDRQSRIVSAIGPDGGVVELSPYDHVVNCAWAGRLAIDDGLGLRPDGPWTFRMKYFLRAPSPPSSPSPPATIVLGPFGDFVDYGSGERYLSWYPAGRRGWSSALAPPNWPTRPDQTTAAAIGDAIVDGLAHVVPAAAVTDPGTAEVRGGIIYALGQTDVDDPSSTFHRRAETGPVTVDGWYHSVDTGKYTTAPLFAVEVADRITSR